MFIRANSVGDNWRLHAPEGNTYQVHFKSNDMLLAFIRVGDPHNYVLAQDLVLEQNRLAALVRGGHAQIVPAICSDVLFHTVCVLV